MKRILSLSLAIMILSSLFTPGLAQAATKTATIKNITEAVYDSMGAYSEGLIWVKKGDTFQYLNESGKVVIDLSKEKYVSNSESYIISAGDFHDGLALVKEEQETEWGGYPALERTGYYIDTKGNIVLTEKQVATKLGVRDTPDMWNDEDYFYGFNQPFSGGVTISEIKHNVKVVVVDKDGNTKTKKGTYDGYYWFTEGLLSFRNPSDYMWGYVDTNLKKVISYKYDDACPFNQGLAPVKVDGKWGFIDKKGKTVIKTQYESFLIMDGYTYQVFADGLAVVKKDGKWGAIDQKGKTVVSFKYDNYLLFCNGYATVAGSDGKYTYIDAKGKVPFKTKYDDANVFTKAGVAVVGNKGVYKLIDTKGKQIGTKTWKFDATWVSNKTPDILAYKKGDKWGIAKIK